MENTKIIIIRHGESLANAQKVYLGHTDWDLSEKGKAQAEEAAEYFAEENIAAVYSSDLLRAYNTALPHARRRGLDVIPDRELREVYLGAWEGLLIDEISRKWDYEFNVQWRENFGTCTPPDGESVSAAGLRFYNEILRIAKLHPGEVVLVAAHAAVIRAFWGRVTETPPQLLAERIPFPLNASATTVILEGDRLVPVDYSFNSYEK